MSIISSAACPDRIARMFVLAACLVLAANCPLVAGNTPDGDATPSEGKDGKAAATAATEEETPDYKNWIDLGIGGLIIHGDAAQFKQEHRMSGDVFGGIEDMHLERSIGKATLSIDGRAIFDNDDYDVKVELSQPGLGYIRGGYTEFRSWYDGNGGFFPVNGQFFSPAHPEMMLDRGEAWVELGLRMPKLPEITLHYSHQFRDGQKDSTIWGDTTLTGLGVNPARKIAPAFRDINETRDIFAIDVLQNFGKTDIGLGMRYEHSEIDDRLQLERGAGQLPPVVAPPGAQRFITQRDENKGDFFSGHVFSETRFTDSIWFTAGYSYTTLGSDLAGSRIFGTHYDAGFGDPIPTLRPFDHGFLNLAGTSQADDHLFNANFLWMPLKNLTVLAAFRYTHENKESDSIFLATDTTTTPPIVQITPVPTVANTSGDFDRFAERLELRYTGIANWLLYAEGELEEEFGNVRAREEGGISEELLNKDTRFLDQKYTAGANWYPMATLNVSMQYYHKIAAYDNDIKSGEFPRLLGQDWNTDDANVRITLRPNIPAWLGTLVLVSRYDFARSTIDTRWFFEGEVMAEEQTGVITKHVFTESITWNPCARLYTQGNFSYVLNKTETPADINLIPNASPTVLDFHNDYWTVSASAGYALDQKTDLRAEYSYYRADNYTNNALVAVPYGMGATEHTVSASVTREITKNVRLRMQYSYFTYTDQTSGGHNNYEAHSLYSSLQFRF